METVTLNQSTSTLQMVEKEATMSQLQIEIKSHRLGDFSGHGLVVIVVTPAGPLNRDTNWQLRLKLQECISKLSKHIVVNLSVIADLVGCVNEM